MLAWPERQLSAGGTAADYEAAREEGARSFTLWRDPDGREAFAQAVTRAASRQGEAEYEVRGAGGEPLATIRREPPSFWRLRRARWSVRQLDQGDRPPAVARTGRIAWWCLWLPFWPIQYVLAHVTFGGFDDIDPPHRTRFRSGGRVVLDYRGNYEDLEVLADWWDPRVTAALLVLIHSWDAGIRTQRNHPSFA
jgi:hypothetical protein